MAIPPWTYELLRKGITDVAKKASETEAVERIKQQASELFQDLPEAAAKGIDAVIKKTEVGKSSIEKWVRRESQVTSPIINASGFLFHQLGTGCGVASVAREMGIELLTGDLTGSSINQSKFEQRLQKLIPDNEIGICITENFQIAIASLGLLAGDQHLLADQSMIDRDPNEWNPIQVLSPPLVKHEVRKTGNPNQSAPVSPDAYAELVEYRGPGFVANEINKQTSHRVMIANFCSLTDGMRHQIPSAWDFLGGGYDFVVMPGNMLCGGPECGLVIGPKSEISRLQKHKAWKAFEAKELTKLMMLVTLELLASDSDKIPVQALLNTGIDNLRSRAARLATRIGSNEKIADCQVMDSTANLTSKKNWSLPSQQLRLKHQSLPTDLWNRNLKQEYPTIITSVLDDSLCIDLRWIDPIHDAKLGEIIGGRIE